MARTPNIKEPKSATPEKDTPVTSNGAQSSEQSQTFNVELERNIVEMVVLKVAKGLAKDEAGAREHALKLANNKPGIGGWKVRPTTAKVVGVSPQAFPQAEVVSVRIGGEVVYARPVKF